MLAQPTRSIYATDGLTPHPRTETVALPELVRFFSHPARTLLRARAGIVADWDEGGVADDVPVTLDGLQAWAIGDRLLSRRLEGRPIEALAATEWRRGLVPPRTLGSRALAPVLETVAGLAEAASPLLSGPRTSRDVLALLPDRRVEGTVASLYQTALVTVSYARLSAKLRLQSWLQLLALTVAAPDTSWRAVSMGRGGRSTLGPVEPDWASRVLADLVELYESGLDGPVPMPPRASAEYARIAFEAKSFEALRGRVEHSWTLERDAAWECFFGPEATLDALLAEPSRAAEERGALAEPSRFGTLARRVWHPLLTAEVLG